MENFYYSKYLKYKSKYADAKSKIKYGGFRGGAGGADGPRVDAVDAVNGDVYTGVSEEELQKHIMGKRKLQEQYARAGRELERAIYLQQRREDNEGGPLFWSHRFDRYTHKSRVAKAALDRVSAAQKLYSAVEPHNALKNAFLAFSQLVVRDTVKPDELLKDAFVEFEKKVWDTSGSDIFGKTIRVFYTATLRQLDAPTQCVADAIIKASVKAAGFDKVSEIGPLDPDTEVACTVSAVIDAKNSVRVLAAIDAMTNFKTAVFASNNKIAHLLVFSAGSTDAKIGVVECAVKGTTITPVKIVHIFDAKATQNLGAGSYKPAVRDGEQLVPSFNDKKDDRRNAIFNEVKLHMGRYEHWAVISYESYAYGVPESINIASSIDQLAQKTDATYSMCHDLFTQFEGHDVAIISKKYKPALEYGPPMYYATKYPRDVTIDFGGKSFGLAAIKIDFSQEDFVKRVGTVLETITPATQ